MKAIVTGASGFVGSCLVQNLINSGFEVASLGRKELKDVPKFRQELIKSSAYLSLDLDDYIKCEKVLKENGFCGEELKYFFHLAWGGNVRLSDLDVEKQSRNIPRTIASYNIASGLGAKRYIFCGTMEESFAEEYTKLDHIFETKYNRHVVYALAKLTARKALKISYKKDGPEILFATNSHVMGPGDDKDSFLQVALSKIIKGEDIIMSSGEQIFDVIDVLDCANAYVAIAEKGVLGSSYWVGSGHPRKLKDYVIEMNGIFPSVNIEFGKIPFSDVVLNRSTFSIEKLTKDTNFLPKFSFRESVTKLANHLNSASVKV